MSDITGVLAEIKGRVEAGLGTLTEEVKDIRSQLDAIDERRQAIRGDGNGGDVNIGRKFLDSPELAVLVKSGRGTARVMFPDLSVKTLVDSAGVGRQSTGVLPIGRIEGVVPEARSALSLLDLLDIRPTGLGRVDYIRINTAASAASQSPEGSAKNESAMTFSSVSRNVITIATWQPCSRQVLEDGPGLEAAIRGSLRFAVLDEIEDQALNGNGAGDALHGILVQAQTFDTSLLPAAGLGWTTLDIIGAAIQQVAADKEIPANVAILNPLDLWTLRMTKDANGNYILGPPNSPNPPRVWGALLVASSNIAQGTFAVGSTDPAAVQIVERMGLVIDVSTEHEDYFVKNKVALRAEARLALVVYRPDAWVTGSLVTSPA